ncbi:hypothetical protein [Kitasatospora sp. MBT66]|uniref:hypothetical protein n=1 Tax=Kitasatospora sp. MBT66 TaxID=1444769 RepID=UPI0005BE8CAF|nr:hypothetical protein [Kitasatospora sp. MBT66]
MTTTMPFDTGLPSPIGRLAQLRARASEAVVRDNRPSDIQKLMAPPGSLEDELWDRLGRPGAPRLLVLTGSAGSGKSATINHLLQRERDTGAGRIGVHLADATHADAPDQEQVGRLAEFFAPFADGTPAAAGPCRVVAMNTGMALRFFHDLRSLPGAPPLAALEALLRRRLGLPGAVGDVPEELESSVLVVNLDHRPTAGEPGDLFEDVLRRLDPGLENGVLEGARRCGTCTVRDWCWPMANAVLISSPQGRAALNSAAGDIALARGRQLAPRALWDTAAELALSGLDLDHGSQGSSDPCSVIADIADRRDEAALLAGLACNNALASARPGSLAAEIAARDPGYAPSRKAHELISYTGLDPDDDAQRLSGWLTTGSLLHPAAARGARALASSQASGAGGLQRWGRVMARAAWLAGDLAAVSGLPPEFAKALQAQASGASSADATEDGRILQEVLYDIEEGLAEVFGVKSSPEYYYPTAATRSRGIADLLVEAKLVEDEWITTEKDPVVAGNPEGSAVVGYRPLALSLNAHGRSIAVDYPLWRILRQAAGGAAPSSTELERFLALRQAIRSVGVAAGFDRNKPLLVREREAAGRKFRITANRNGTLRTTEVQ